MRRVVILFFALFTVLSGCVHNETTVIPPEQTVLVYMPWSGNETGGSLIQYIKTNLEEMKQSILANDLLTKSRVLVFLSETPTEARLFELTKLKGEIVETPVKEYTSPAITTSDGIYSILQDVLHQAPAERYAMIIGSHGMGWLTVPAVTSRYFGGTISKYQANISTLADAIERTGEKMEYILFDDCYMSCIEVAYELRMVTEHLIACPTEIMARGFPYNEIAQYLLGTPNYAALTKAFMDFYNRYTYPYATIGITVTKEVEALAAIMKEINRQFTFDTKQVDDLQRLDGFTPVVYFDLGDYVTHLCADPTLLETFRAQMYKALPPTWQGHTEQFYTVLMYPNEIDINKDADGKYLYSGCTISDPSINTSLSLNKQPTVDVTVVKTRTAWYKATHEPENEVDAPIQ
jgi:hypothetical protein